MATQRLSSCLVHSTSASSAAAGKAFVQLASRRCISTAPVLDFLLPARSSPFISRSSSSLLRAERVRGARLRAVGQQRGFSATKKVEETRCLYNPKRDEEGEFMNIEITPRAAHRLNAIATKDKNPNTALRITVESGGCHGFQYLMSLTSLPSIDPATQKPLPSSPSSEPSTLDPDEDTIFAYHDEHAGTDADKIVARVVMDEPSLELLKGSSVDYTMELIGSQFKVAGNPRASSSCGCGTSFDVKF